MRRLKPALNLSHKPTHKPPHKLAHNTPHDLPPASLHACIRAFAQGDVVQAERALSSAVRLLSGAAAAHPRDAAAAGGLGDALLAMGELSYQVAARGADDMDVRRAAADAYCARAVDYYE
eukprot:181472-Chlamydomonas_euryale.AAC.2